MNVQSFILYSTFSCIITLSTISPIQAQVVVPPDELCIQCLCEMASGCNLTVGCVGDGLCGPFRMTRPYWIDAGKPVLLLDDPERPGAFARCANDPVCAANTVKSYINLFAEDCNEDNTVDCMDYARIHQYGSGTFCKHPLHLPQLMSLQRCL